MYLEYEFLMMTVDVKIIGTEGMHNVLSLIISIKVF